MIRWADVNDSGNDHILAVDDVSVSFTTGTPPADTTPPVFASGSPSTSGVTTSGFTLSSTINEVGTTYYVVLPSGASAPSAAQVKAGQDQSGTVVAANLRGTITNGTANTAATAAVSGLSGSTTYDVYVVAEDGVPNLQTAPVKVTVTTTTPVSAPTISSFTPDNGVVGTSVTITGTNFTNAATVSFNGTAATTVNFVSGTELTALVPTGATTGTISVTTAGGTATSAASFTVNNPAPTLTSISPNTRVAGSGSFTLTATGTGFVNSSVVNFNGAALTTTFGSSTSLTATVPASAIATAGTYDVTVTSPAPGGGTSAPQTFTVSAAPATLAASTTALEGFVTAAGVASAQQQYSLTATGLTAPITVTAPTGYQVSLSSGSGYAQQITVPQTGGTVYVIIGDAAAAGVANGTITNVSGSSSVSVTVTGQVFAAGSTACVATEGFESTTFPPTNWLAVQVSRGAGEGKNGNAGASFGSTNAGTLTMPRMANPVGITFFLGRTTNTTAKTMEIEVSTTSQTTGFTSIFTLDHSNVPSGSYNFYSVDLSAYTANAQVWVRFRKTGGSTSPWRLDDVTGYCGAPPAAPEIDITQGATAVASGGSVSVGSTAVGGSTPVTFTITNSGSASLQLTGTAPDYVALSGANAAEFSVTQQPATPIGFAAGSNTTSFTVTFQPTSGGAKTATLTIANNDSNEGTYTITLNATATVPLAAEPTVQPTVTVSNVTPTSADLTVAGGDGTARLVVVRPSSATAVAPTDGTSYAASPAYGGATTGVNNYVVLSGTATTVTITGLSLLTDYTVDVYAYNGTGGAENYLATAPGTATFTTTAPPALTWDGGGDGSSFADALNWVGDVAPTTGNSVIFDHSVVTGTYNVNLPSGAPTALSLSSLIINPGGGAPITVTLPNTNTTASYLRLTRSTAAFVIYSGGTFVNASNSSSGASVDVTTGTENFIIYNGGSYVHQTGRSVSDLLDNLSTAAGTETGRFVYNVPGSAYTLALSGRTYGSLVLQATASTSFSYTGAGSSELLIRGNLEIDSNVTFAPTLNADISIGGNLSNGGNFRFAPATGTTRRFLVLNGTTAQTISGNPLTAGTSGTSYLGNNVALRLNNAAGVTLATPVTINGGASSAAARGGLDLVAGILTTSSTNLLTLNTNATILNTAGPSSFVNGPLARTVAAGTTGDVLFPVGKDTIYRPLILTPSTLANATTFTAEQKEGRPVAGPALTGGLTRVSQVRQFTITPSPVPAAGEFTGTVTLSFDADDQVTDPTASTLVIAKNSGSSWENIGRSANTGASNNGAYVAGTLTSGTFTSFSDFALASTDPLNIVNPLPVVLTSFTAQRQGEAALLRWTTAQEKLSAYFEVQRSTDGREFRTLDRVQAAGQSTSARHYTFRDATAPGGTVYYRLRQVDQDGTAALSDIRALQGAEVAATLYPNPVQQQLRVASAAPVKAWRVLSLTGKLLLSGTALEAGIDVSQLPAGSYALELRTTDGARTMLRFVKQ